MNSWQYSTNIIIMLYRPYASGKFISNVLSFNDEFCPQICLDPGVKRWHSSVTCLDHLSTFDQVFFKQRKIQEIFDTIPPPRDHWSEWLEYELGCNMFWGTWAEDFDLKKVRPAVINILELGYRCFLMSHTFENLTKLRSFFPNAKVVQIINDEKILSKNLALKVPTSGHLQRSLLREDHSLLQFDINTVFDESLFFAAIDALLTTLNIADRVLDPQVYEYYRKYTTYY